MQDADLIALLRWILEAISIAALIGTALWLKTQLDAIPERLPTHFGITGKPDRWGGRWVVWLLLAIQVGTYVAMSVAGKTLNLITGEPTGHTNTALVMTIMKCSTTGMLAYVLWVTIRVGRGQAQRLNVFVLLTFIAALTVPALLLGKK